MRELGRAYHNRGYGVMFNKRLFSENPMPYYSYGNGAAMRASPCGFAAKSIEETVILSKKATEITHNHPEGLKGAEAAAVAVYLARSGCSISKIREFINDNYYPLDFTLEEIRGGYRFDESCQGTAPQAVVAFLELSDFEDAIKNAVSIGGDSDTLAAVTGGIAEGCYAIPKQLCNKALAYLDEGLIKILEEFENNYQ
jgi:type I restriction enzyme M protein